MSSTSVFFVPQANDAQSNSTASPTTTAFDSDAPSPISLQSVSLSPVFSQSLEYIPGRDQIAHEVAPKSRARALAPRKGSPGRETHIPRPRNPFMIFRSEWCANKKITSGVERDHRLLSRIIGQVWNRLPEPRKAVYRLKAEQEKIEHQRKYPGYRFTPGARAVKPVKRNVKRNGSVDLARCKKVADLLLAGKHGDELELAVQIIDATAAEATQATFEHVVDSSSSTSIPISADTSASPSLICGWAPTEGESEEAEIALFRSPLLPPKTPENLDVLHTQSLDDPLVMDAFQPDHPPVLASLPSSSSISTLSPQVEPLYPDEVHHGFSVPDAVIDHGQQAFFAHPNVIAPATQFHLSNGQFLQMHAMCMAHSDCSHLYSQSQMIAPPPDDAALPDYSTISYGPSLSGPAPVAFLPSSLDLDAFTTFTNPFDTCFSAPLAQQFHTMSQFQPVDPLTWAPMNFGVSA